MKKKKFKKKKKKFSTNSSKFKRPSNKSRKKIKHLKLLKKELLKGSYLTIAPLKMINERVHSK